MIFNISILFSHSFPDRIPVEYAIGVAENLKQSIPSSALAIFRACAFLVIFGTDVGILFSEPLQLAGTNRKFEIHKVTLKGFARFSTFTVSA